MKAGNAPIDCEQRRSGQSCPSQRSAEPSVKTGAVGAAGEWVVGEAVMVIPDMCGGHRRVRRKLVLSEDSGGQPTSSRTGWGFNIANATRRGHSEPPRYGLLRG